MPEGADGGAPDSRPARAEAIEAGVLWLLALIATVGLSTWLGSQPAAPALGVPRWALFGVFGPWVAFFILHLRFCLRRRDGDTGE